MTPEGEHSFRAQWELGHTIGLSKVHSSPDGRFTTCGRLVPERATVTIAKTEVTCGRCLEVIAGKKRKKEREMSPTIKYKGPHGDFIKLYNDLQGIAAQTKGKVISWDLLSKVKKEMAARLEKEFEGGTLEKDSIRLLVKVDSEDSTRLIVDFLPSADATEDRDTEFPLPDPEKPMDKQGLLGKYLVFKVEGGGAPDVLIVGPDGEGGTLAVGAWMKQGRCFVLSPEKDDAYGKASRAAVMVYADAIREKNPQLADDLSAWMKKVM